MRVPIIMDKPRWFSPLAGRQRRVSYLDGLDLNPNLPSHQACRYWSEDRLIDASIAPLIVRLNELGHETEFCCSHLDEDHRGKPGAVWGHVQFRDNPPAMVPAAFVRSARGFHVRLKDDLTNEEKLAAWREWEKMLG